MKKRSKSAMLLLLLATLSTGLLAQVTGNLVLSNASPVEPSFAVFTETSHALVFETPGNAKLDQSEYETAYIYAHALLKGGDEYVITNVYKVTIHPDYCSLAQSALEKKLEQYIEHDLGKEVFTKYSNCATKLGDANDWQSDTIDGFTRGYKKFKYSFPGYNFSFSYNQQDYDD